MLRVEDLTETEKRWYDFITTTRMRIKLTSAEALTQLTKMREENEHLRATRTEEQEEALKKVADMYEIAGTLD